MYFRKIKRGYDLDLYGSEQKRVRSSFKNCNELPVSVTSRKFLDRLSVV
jgi:hypothetical protein